MAIRQRAIQAEDKEERHHAILDAAARLLARAPDRLANMAEVADEAGLAKGTVYLYFPSKEALLLALHERTIDVFFDALSERLQGVPALTIDEMFGLVRARLISPHVLSLGARCLGIMIHAVPIEAATAFKERMGQRLARTGEGLERHFPSLTEGRGISLLRQSYALIIGLWQMGPDVCPLGDAAAQRTDAQRTDVYAADLEEALRALWRGALLSGEPHEELR